MFVEDGARHSLVQPIQHKVCALASKLQCVVSCNGANAAVNFTRAAAGCKLEALGSCIGESGFGFVRWASWIASVNRAKPRISRKRLRRQHSSPIFQASRAQVHSTRQ